MILRRYRSTLEVWAPAKLNLFLEVAGRRPDGYHEIETLVVPIRLFDTLRIANGSAASDEFSAGWSHGLIGRQRPDPSGSAVDAWGDLPQGADNLVVKALELAGREGRGEVAGTIRLIKRIPSMSGLGGASSDAAAALVAANEFWRLRFSPERLADLAAKLGSDVPCFLGEGPTICRGRGERVQRVPIGRRLFFVVVRPPAGLSTRDVYAACCPSGAPRQAAALAEAVRSGVLPQIAREMFNRLESAAARLSPWIERLRGEFRRLDVLGHQMTGSGTAYFGLCRGARHARRLAERLRARRIGYVFSAASI